MTLFKDIKVVYQLFVKLLQSASKQNTKYYVPDYMELYFL